MIWTIILQLVSLICIVLFRLRLLRQIQQKVWTGVFLRCSIYAIISVLCIALLARLRNSLYRQSLISPLSLSISSTGIILSLIAIVSIGILLRRRSRLSSLLQSSLLIALSSFYPSLSQSLTNIRSEETLKQVSLQWWWHESIFSDNNKLFLLACVSAIIFGGIENILFFIRAQNDTGIITISYIIQRSLIPLLIHIASVGTTIMIGYRVYHYYNTMRESYWKPLSQKNIFLFSTLSVFLASIGWVIFHSIYNFSLTYQIRVIIPLLCIISIGMISYGLFRSDLLYTN